MINLVMTLPIFPKGWPGCVNENAKSENRVSRFVINGRTNFDERKHCVLLGQFATNAFYCWFFNHQPIKVLIIKTP